MAVAAPQPASAQDAGKIASDFLHQRLPGDSVDLSRREAVAGLKEALGAGAAAAVTRLGAEGGFAADAEVRIGLPGVLGETQSRLQPFGMSGPLDDLQMRLNRAAEAAVPAAGNIFAEAISSMTVDDVMTVLRGGDTAATDYLRRHSHGGLTAALRPYVEEALDSSGAMTALDSVAGRYGAGRIATDARSWLTDHAVGGALDGLFYYVAREEQAIRRDPVKRTSDLLRRVFGG